MRLPLFIEVSQSAEQANAMVCRKIMAELFKQKISPLPCAGNLKEVKDVLEAMHSRGTQPSVFIVNTFGASGILEQLDPLIGTTPTLFLYRRIASEATLKTTIMVPRVHIPEILEKMTPRPNTIWTFGSQTSDEIAQKAAKALIEFFSDGDFFHVERHSELQQALINKKGSLGFETVVNSNSCSPSGRIAVADSRPASGRITIPASAPSSGRIVVQKPSSTSSGRIPIPPAATPSSASMRPIQQPPATTAITGFIEQLGLPALLMMFEMEKKTGELMVSARSETARLLLKQGRIIQACADGLSVPLECQSGIESIYYMLTWKTGSFEFNPKEINVPDEINMAMTGILMEAARRSDEPAIKKIG